MNAREWTEWFTKNRTWAAKKGSRVAKAVISTSMEMDWDKAYLDDVMGDHELTLNEKAQAHLCGVPVMFTDKLPAGRVLWVLEDINGVRIPRSGGPIGQGGEAS